jgi:hypothetical protein
VCSSTKRRYGTSQLHPHAKGMPPPKGRRLPAELLSDHAWSG